MIRQKNEENKNLQKEMEKLRAKVEKLEAQVHQHVNFFEIKHFENKNETIEIKLPRIRDVLITKIQ